MAFTIQERLKDLRVEQPDAGTACREDSAFMIGAVCVSRHVRLFMKE